MLHILFQEPDIAALQNSFELDQSLRGDILQIKDDFAVGPLSNIYSPEGMDARKHWWREVLSGGDYDGHVDRGIVDDRKTVETIRERLRNDSNELIWIWAAPNKHDVCSYYWLMSQLKEFQGRIFILYLHNLPFLNTKGNLFYPVNLAEIPPKEFVKAKKLAREVTPSEFEVDPDEWTRLCNEQKGIRLLEGGKTLVQEDYDFYDNELAKFVTANWQKASKIIQQYLTKSTHTTGDAYLLWRLKLMIAMKRFDVQGNVANMKDFELKTPTAP